MRTASVGLLLGAAFAIAGSRLDAEQLRPGKPSPGVTEISIFGRPLMTPEEVDAYHALLESALTAEEREILLHQHCERMAQRARERGITLPGMATDPEEPICGQELMIPQEIAEYRKRLRELDEKERESAARAAPPDRVTPPRRARTARGSPCDSSAGARV
jgi:hypothetical protein